MTNAAYEKKSFDGVRFAEKPLPPGEYDACVFTNCDFSGAMMAGWVLLDCRFVGCNLSMANISGASLRDVAFSRCKLLGLRFDTCNPIGLSIECDECALDHSSFYKAKIRKTVFRNSHLLEVDFSAADLTESVFDNCDLSGAVFSGTRLEKVDFRTSVNFSIDPDTNRIKKAKFSLAGIAGLLDKYDIQIDFRSGKP
jgi:uncharacterized protein YjbI with pentapeptide repeats